MRVLHFFKTYWPDSFGGMERAIHAIACGTADHGVTSRVLSLSRDPVANSVEFDGHQALKAKLDFEIASTGFSRAAIGLFREQAAQVDLIHYHFPWPFMDVVHFLARTGKPAVVSYQSDIVKQKTLLMLYRPLMKRFLADMDRIVVASPNYLATSRDLAPFRDKCTVIANGLAERDYPAPSGAVMTRWRERFGEPFFLFTGVLRYYKGLHVLIEAARLSGLPVVIVGSGPMEESLKAQAQDLSNVHFVGPLPDEDKIALLMLSRAFVFPSHLRSEAFGLSLVEASMFGKAMICAEIGTGTSWINRDRQTGIVVPPEDAAALGEAMRSLDEDKDLAQRYGAAARRRYLEFFTAERMADDYAALYRDVLEVRS